MGLPSFYRWLIERYPLILQDVIEEEPLEIGGVKVQVDTSKPNPNGVEYDNLYLDMNGIIHPCFHPEDRSSPTTFSEAFQCMFDYIDRLFVMVRPRKLLFLAIDGVAPRAKMNQQRSRRFRAAKDAAEAVAEEERLRQEFESEGKRLPPKVDSQVFDSNVITPGTEFMSTLSIALQYYIHVRLNSDPGWKNIKVILSDANVPGEGEHKIMSYIRLQKNHSGYNPNTCHCLYGLDADLIMLALATHEVHISILREVVFTPGQQEKCFLCGQLGHRAADCEGKVKRKAGEMIDNAEKDVVAKKPYQFVNIWTLREYLEHDMQIPNSQLQKHFGRIIDDFIFICFFVGNDFLPHMPTLEIREGAIELLMYVYKKEFGSITSYLSNGSKLNLKNVEHFIQAVGLYEDNIFQRRAQTDQGQSERFSRDRAQSSRKWNYDPVVSDSLPPSLDDSIGVANMETENSIEEEEEIDNREELKFKLKKLLREKSDGFSSGKGEEDKVRLGVQGWRERYYEEKFTAKTIEEMEQTRRDVVLKYTEGLCWIMHYYYHGICSWNWFYPYHYAPFASDLKSLDKLDIKFELGSPFKPFNQLLAVLPSASAHALPECFRNLMTDPTSPIAEFYPPDFEIDMNGKRYSWQGIAKLPFIEEQRLLEAAAEVEHSLTNEEIRRNSVLCDMLFVVASHPLAKLIRALNRRTKNLSNEERATTTEKIGPGLSEGMNGYLASCGGDSQPSCFSSPIEGMEDVLANQVICAIYKLPEDLRRSDISRPPPGVVLPKKTVQLADLKSGANLWHEEVAARQTDSAREPKTYLAKMRDRGRATFGCCLSPLKYLSPRREKITAARETIGQSETDRGSPETPSEALVPGGIVGNQNPITVSPKPRSYMAKLMGPSLAPFGRCLTPRRQDDNARGLRLSRTEVIENEAASEAPIPSHVSEGEIQPADIELPRDDNVLGLTGVVGKEEGADGEDKFDNLLLAITQLNELIAKNFAKDPLEALKKEREELSTLVKTIGGLTTVASVFSPPGGLDGQGYIRFRYTLCYWMFLGFNHLAFLFSYANLAQLHKPLKEQEQERKAAALRSKIKIGWFFLWVAVLFFFGSFTLGFWIVYPGEDPPNPVTYRHKLGWPRWFVLGINVSKIIGTLAYLFGRR